MPQIVADMTYSQLGNPRRSILVPVPLGKTDWAGRMGRRKVLDISVN